MVRKALGRPPLILLAFLLAPAVAHAQDIAVQLLFDGKPLQATARPAFSCRDDGSERWTTCTIAPDPDSGGYVLRRPGPGTYTLHVEIDENKDNPARFPGDYDVFQQFEVTGDGPAALDVHMHKLMRMRFPWDNNHDLNGMLTLPWSEKPIIETLRRSRSHTASVNFKWDAVAPAVEYSYVVYDIRDAPSDRVEAFKGTTKTESVRLRLPRSAPGRYFALEVWADKDGREIGTVFTYDAGVQGFTIEFVVHDWSGRPDATVVAPTADAALLDEWRQAIPQPAWWDEVPPQTLAIQSLGDLLSVWQTDAGDDSNHRLYKLTYQAILDHSGDRHLVARAISTLAGVAEPDQRFRLLTFGVDHFFSYNQRIDNCAHCKIGDETAGMVRDLADLYISRGRPEVAIQLIQRLLGQRESDISDYHLALTFETLSRAHWDMKDAAAATAAALEGLKRFPVGWQADQLRRALERYEKGPR